MTKVSVSSILTEMMRERERERERERVREGERENDRVRRGHLTHLQFVAT